MRRFAVLILIVMSICDASGRTNSQPRKRKTSSSFKPSPLASAAYSLKTKTGSYQVTEDRNSDHLRIKTIVGDDFKEIKIDLNGDGTADVWEIAKDAITFKATNPYRGHFVNLEIKQADAKGVVISKFIFSAKNKSYNLVSKTFEASRLHFANELVIGGKCTTSHESRFHEFEALVDQIQTQANAQAEEALSCRIKAMKPLFFDSSCTDSAKFKDSTEEMTNGLAKVLASAVTKGIGKKETPRFLGCLERYGLAEHSARIQALINQRYVIAENTMSKGNFTEADRQAVASARPPACELSAELQTKMKGNLSSGVKLFKCGPPTGKFGPSERAAFDDKFGAEQIILSKNKHELPSLTKTNATNGYANTIFHELVHSSGVKDENLTREIEGCCAPDDNDGVVVSKCTSLLAKTKIKEDVQLLEGTLALGSFKESQTTIQYDLNQALGSGSQAEIFMDQYKSYIASRRDQDFAEMNSLKDSEGKQCGGRDQSNECSRLQAAFTQEKWQKHTREFFATRCEGLMMGFDANDAGDKKALCGKFQGRFENMVTSTVVSASELTVINPLIIEIPKLNLDLFQTYINFTDEDGHYETVEGEELSDEQKAKNEQSLQGNPDGDKIGAGNGVPQPAEREAAEAQRQGVAKPILSSAGNNLPIPAVANRPERLVSSETLNVRASPIRMAGDTTQSRADFVRGVRRSEFLVANAASVLERASVQASRAVLPRAVAETNPSVTRPISIPVSNFEFPQLASLQAPSQRLGQISTPPQLTRGNTFANASDSLESLAPAEFNGGRAPSGERNMQVSEPAPRGATGSRTTFTSSTQTYISTSSSVQSAAGSSARSYSVVPIKENAILRDVSQARTFLTRDYSTVAPYLERTQFRRELIDLQITVRDRENRTHGCRTGSCLRFEFCKKSKRLAPAQEC